MKQNKIEQIEIDLLLETIFKRYGYDFRQYSRASIERRIRHFLDKTNSKSISSMIPEIIHNEKFFEQMVQYFSITVTEMFRDPFVYRSIRENVIPILKTFPFIKIWVAGCATGEEVYSLAILLKEEGLYEKSTIYATDFNDDALKKAKHGIYNLEKAKDFTKNYQETDGKKSFSDYYHADFDAFTLNNNLKDNITFANHNLVTDSVFSEMHFIMCRNVMIYFNKELQDHVLNLFDNSLIRNGFLCIGTKENINFSKIKDHYKTIDEKSKIFKKT